MATFLSEEESGFFNAEEVELEDGSTEYDRVYDSEQFSNYFSLFVGNGVFINPENQLLVSEVSGQISRAVSVNAGWAFINGMFYHNKEAGSLDVAQNITSTVRKDGVFCRYSKADRSINVKVVEGRIEPKRLEYDYELLLAIVEVGPGVTSITNANITDTRPNENVCGFVKGLQEVIETDDLFQQFNSQFNQWFTALKQQFGSDAVGIINSRLTELETDSATKEEVNESVTYLQTQITNLSNGKSNKSTIVDTAIQASSWVGNSPPYTNDIQVNGVVENTIVEVHLPSTANSDQVKVWNNANIMDGGQETGKITLKAWGIKPSLNIPIKIIVRGDV